MYLGIDIGTSGVKALLMDDQARVVGSHDARLSVSRPQPGWSEQDPDDWIAAVGVAIAGLRAGHGQAFAKLAAIGLAGQMHGATLLGADDRPLRPCILWNDGRSGEECVELEARVDVRGLSGNIAMAGFTAPKLLWVARHEPDVFARIAKVLLPKDYVRLWLTGEHASDMSDSAGTLWLDVAGRRWSDALLAASDLTRDQMPRVVEGTETSGLLRADLAAEWGVPQVPVAGGGGDNAATACGMGLLSPGSGFLSLGTSGVLFTATERFAPNTDEAVHAFCHAVPDRWHQMGATLSAVDSLTWLARQLGGSPPELAALVPLQVSQPSEAMFLPYLSGERTPHNDPSMRGAFVDLSATTDRAAMVQAVMEGVAFALADCHDALTRHGAPLGAVYAVGGGVRSASWLRIIAAATGLTLLIPEMADLGAAFGAAKLARASLAPRFEAADFPPPGLRAEMQPDPALAEAYLDRRTRFRALYAALHPGKAGHAKPGDDFNGLAAAILGCPGRAAGHETLGQALSDPLLAGLLWRVMRDDLAALWPDRAALDRAMVAAYASARQLPTVPPPVMRKLQRADRPVLGFALQARADRAATEQAFRGSHG
jgi:xylulokinase